MINVALTPEVRGHVTGETLMRNNNWADITKCAMVAAWNDPAFTQRLGFGTLISDSYYVGK